MAREVWKGSLRFGLVTIPVGLHPAESRQDLHLSMLDRKDLSPVGYAPLNKTTGKQIDRSQVVKGYEVESGRFVLVTDQDIKAARIESTQTVDIVGFVKASEIPLLYFDTPYYLAPGKDGRKAYVLLREALSKSGRIGVARVVIRTREYTAAVYPSGKVLVLNLLRYAHELRDVSELDLPQDDARSRPAPRELAMAEQLIHTMDEEWKPEQYKDEYHDSLLQLIKTKARTGRSPAAKKLPAAASPKVLDLMGLLKQSLDKKGRGRGATASERPARRKAR